MVLSSAPAPSKPSSVLTATVVTPCDCDVAGLDSLSV